MAGAAMAETIKRFDAGFWQGGAQIDANGDLFDCYLRAKNLREGYAIFLRYDPQGIHLTLMDESWSLPEGDSFKGRVRIDRRFDKEIQGSVLAGSIVDYVLGYDEAAWESVRKGSAITLEGPAGTKTFPLTGTSRAMDRLFDCADEYFGNPEDMARASVPAAPAPVPVPAPPPPAPQEAGDDPEALVRRAMAIASGLEEGSPEEAFAAADALAATGNRDGKWLSGRFALAGYGSDMPYEQAIARILSAAEAGHPEALTFIGLEYLGSSDKTQQITGKIYLLEAAVQGHEPALAALRLIDEGARQ